MTRLVRLSYVVFIQLENVSPAVGITGELLLRDYSSNMNTETSTEMDTPDRIILSETSPYVVVRSNNGTEKVVRKSSICWLLSKDRFKLSSDRLVRVQEKDYQKGTTGIGIFGETL